MKVRIQRNSIRLRLTISEVGRLAEGKTVSSTLEISPIKFTYELKAGRVDNIAVSFAQGTLAATIPFADAKDLALTDRVGVRSTGSPEVVIEKDFGCARPRPDEDVSDLYGYAAMR